MKPRILVTGVGTQYGGTEVVVSRFIGALSNQFAFDSVAHSQFKQPEFSQGDNRTIVMPLRHENALAYERATRHFFQEKSNSYQAIWHNSNSFSNIDHLKLAVKYGIPVRICHFHNTEVLGNSFNKVLHGIHRGSAGRLATCRLAVSKEAGEFAFGKQPFHVFPDAFDVSSFAFDGKARDDVRRELGLERDFVVGTVGRLAEQKNQAFLIDLMPELLRIRPDTKLVIVGNGTLESALRSRAEMYGIADRVVLTGVRTDIERVLSAFDVFAFPSLFEGLGVAAIEAQANGLQCVLSTNVPECAVVSGSVRRLSLDDQSSWIEAISRGDRRLFKEDRALLEQFDIRSAARVLASYFRGEMPPTTNNESGR